MICVLSLTNGTSRNFYKEFHKNKNKNLSLFLKIVKN